MLKTIGGESLIRLMTTGESDTIQFAATKNSSIINMSFVKQCKAIKKVGSSNDKVDQVDIIDINSTKVSKLAKFKDLVQSKESGAGFFTPKARLTFTQLR